MSTSRRLSVALVLLIVVWIPGSPDRTRGDTKLPRTVPQLSDPDGGRPQFNGAVKVVIEHLCAHPEHQIPEDAPNPVIPHAERWGYCPAGDRDGHDWRATGGKTLATVRDWLGRPPG